MPLYETPDNPAPPGAVVEQMRAVDGVRLRAVRWTPARPARGTVVVLGGRTEFVEKYFETIQELLDRSFCVAALDWRGQGGSERQLRNKMKGHIDDFSLFERDLAALATEVLGPSCPRPWFGLANSMGASILLSIAHAGRCPFDRIVLLSPMIEVISFQNAWTALLAEALDALGLGGAFAPGGGSRPGAFTPFGMNVLTSDPERYARTAAVLRAHPEIGLGWPTVGWVHAAIRHMRRLKDPDFPLAITTPSLVIASGGVRVVDTRACERFAERLRSGRLIVLDGAEHEILNERDLFRDAFWAAFDAFIPGTEGEKAA